MLRCPRLHGSPSLCEGGALRSRLVTSSLLLSFVSGRRDREISFPLTSWDSYWLHLMPFNAFAKRTVESRFLLGNEGGFDKESVHEAMVPA